VKHIVVRKPDDAIISLLIQPLCALSVVSSLIGIGVNIAIYLNHQFGFSAKEVHDEAAYSVLLTDMCAVHLPIAGALPEFLFGRCHLPAELPGAGLHLRGGAPAFVRGVGHGGIIAAIDPTPAPHCPQKTRSGEGKWPLP